MTPALPRPTSGGSALPAAPGSSQADCGLPAAWAGQDCWRILETDFGTGSNFLAAWQAWRLDAARARQLHFVSCTAAPFDATDLEPPAGAAPGHTLLAQALAHRWWGLTPGVHRLAFEGGKVVLALCVGEAGQMLREQSFQADSVFLAGSEPLTLLKGVARLCRPGAGFAAGGVGPHLLHDLASSGFVVDFRANPAGTGRVAGRFAPGWPTHRAAHAPLVASTAVVIGAGLAGAAAAAALARRGWRVEVLDGATQAAAGASALPAGLLAPHQSPDDNLLSRLSRAGVRTTLQEAEALLRSPDEWAAVPVLEHRGTDARPVPSVAGLAPWSREATPDQLPPALAMPQPHGWWHERAAWIRPSALVHAWLRVPGVRFRGEVQVHAIDRDAAGWNVIGAQGEVLARAPLVVVAAAGGSAALLRDRIQLHPVRGQVSWGLHDKEAAALPPNPLNGAGHFMPRFQVPEGAAWLTGSTYGRGETDARLRRVDDDANLERLRGLAPQAAAALAPQWRDGRLRSWAGIRYVSRDRRPLVGELAPGLWTTTAMGSRGLTFAALCAQVMVAQLHQDPLPMEQRLVKALSALRPLGRA